MLCTKIQQIMVVTKTTSFYKFMPM